MRSILLAALAMACVPEQTTAQEAAGQSNKSAADAVYLELADGLRRHQDEKRARSAMLELKWYEHPWRQFGAPVRKAGKTKEGNAAEVVFLSAPSLSMPGSDFSMAFLLIEKRVVDWASCRTSNRRSRHKLLLDDVDGDGLADVAFQAQAGWGGFRDKRQRNIPGDERIWLYAYAITSKGFESLFPENEPALKVKLSYDPAEQPVDLYVDGLPATLKERQVVECAILIGNHSDQQIIIKPGKWFAVDADNAKCVVEYYEPDEQTTLNPRGEVMQVMRLYVENAEGEEVTLRWKFVPDGVTEQRSFEKRQAN